MYSRIRNTLKRILPQPIRNFANHSFIISSNEKNSNPFADIMHIPPMTRAKTELFGKSFEFIDRSDFLFLYDEIITKEIYHFTAINSEPYIIDGGANIGMSVIYFKEIFPEAKIIGYEPDPEIFDTLNRNCHTFGLQDVKVYQEALWKENGIRRFKKQGSLGGRLAVNDGTDYDLIVKTTRLKDLLDRRVDFLKLDIEGAETEVLEDCGILLKNVMNLFVEYHSFINLEQTLHRLLTVVYQAGFRIHIHVYEPSPQPFISRNIREGIDRVDMNLDIFCFRQ
jgi:FkbM family methyltransferase